MLPKQLSPTSNCGYTILELLVSTTIGSILAAMIFSSLLFNRNTFLSDIEQTKIQKNLRTGMDIISLRLRQAGENLSDNFPAVELVDGASGAPDILILRRNLLTEVLTLCDTASTAATELYVSDNTEDDGECLNANVQELRNAWSAKRTAEGGSVKIYIYNWSSEQGEFLDYSAEGQTSVANGEKYYLTTSTLANSYAALTTNLYVLEEHRYELNTSTDTLELDREGDAANPQSVVYDTTDFQVSITLQDGTVLSSLADTDSNTWKEVKMVNVSLTGSIDYHAETITETLTAEYFPNNVLFE